MADAGTGTDRDPVERLADSYLARFRAGERPSIEEYAAKYPALADELRELLPALVELERNFSPDHTATGGATSRVPPEPAPRQLGDYRIVREIGRGGMGVVYEAMQQSLGRHVALKVLPAGELGGAAHLERFRREARAAARLHHTNIVPVFGVGEQGGVHYYAMQYIRGQGLDAVVEELRHLRADRSPPRSPAAAAVPASDDPAGQLRSLVASGLLTGRFAAPEDGAEPIPDDAADVPATTPVAPGPEAPARAEGAAPPPPTGDHSELSSTLPGTQYHRSVARVGLQVAGALAYAHDQGILHRDIKPSNLLLDARGTVWVTDFGLAKADDSDELTRTGDIVGTLRYMAPERFEGHSDPRSDVYGLGVTLYELLTLRPLFEEPHRARLIERVLHDAPPSPRKLDPHIPRDLETIVLRALAKEPDERYGSARELAEDLRRFLEYRPIRARRATAAELVAKWARRHPSVVGAAAVLMIVILAGLSLGLVLLGREQARTLEKAVLLGREQARTLEKAEALAEKVDALRRQDYIHRIHRAYSEANDNNISRADELLDGCPADLRGWEWSFVKRLGHLDLGTFEQPGQVHAVAFSADGRSIASGGGDWPWQPSAGKGELVVRDAETGREIFSRHGLENVVQGVAFHPDGRILATAVGRGGLILWDAATGRVLTRRVEEGPAACLAFRPDGEQLAVVFSRGKAARGGYVQLCDPRTGEERGPRIPAPPGGTAAVSYSPDGERIALTGNDSVDVWDLGGEEPHRLITLGGFTSYVYAVAFSPDGERIATGGWDRAVQLWEAETGREIRSMTGHAGFIYGVAFSPDGRTLASASEDRAVKLWEVATGRELGTFRGHASFAKAVAFSPGGDRLASGGIDGAVKLWSATTSLPIVMETGAYAYVAFRPDGSRLATSPGWMGRDPTVKLWDPVTGRRIAGFHERLDGRHPDRLITFGPDARTLITVGMNRVVRIQDAGDGHPIAEFPSPGDSQRRSPGITIYDTAFRPDGRQAATRNPDGTVTVWDTETGRPIRTLSGHTAPVVGLAYRPDGRVLASASAPADPASGHYKPGGEVKLWDLETGGEPRTLRRDVGVFQVVTFSPDGRRLALAEAGAFAKSGEVHVWDVTTGQDVFVLRGHTSNVSALAFSPDGRRLASGSLDRTIKLWDTDTGDEVLTLRGHTAGILSLAFSLDGRRLASGGIDWTARIWDASPLVEERRTRSK